MDARRGADRWMLCLALVTAVGCGGRPSPLPSNPGTATATADVAAPRPDHRLHVAPREDLAAAIRLAHFDDATDDPQERVAVMEVRGSGAVVVHVMLYRDRSRREGDEQAPREERCIDGYDLIPFPPLDSAGPAGLPTDGRPTAAPDRNVDRTLVIDVRRGMVRLSLGQEAESAAAGTSSARDASTVQRSYARGIPRAGRDARQTVVAAIDVGTGHQPRVPWSQRTSAGVTGSVKGTPATLEPGASVSVAAFDTDEGQVAVAVEHLPFRATVTPDELGRIADEYRDQASQDPHDVAARYWFAWAAVLSGRKEALAEARGLLAEAQRREPHNRALAALRGHVAVGGVRTNTFDDEPAALQAATDLLDSHPTALACETAAHDLARASGSDRLQATSGTIAALVREALALDAESPILLANQLQRWRARLAGGSLAGGPAVSGALEEFGKSAP